MQGQIVMGGDADFVIWRPNNSFTVRFLQITLPVFFFGNELRVLSSPADYSQRDSFQEQNHAL
jgi:hypothetical protein